MTLVTCAIIIKDRKILVTQRGEKMKLPLKWEFPGGKIEENEVPEECILREIKEELDIEIELTQRLAPSMFSYDSFQICLIPFVAKYISGQVTLAEHKAFEWVDSFELNIFDWAEADIPVVNEFLKVNQNAGWTL